MVRMTPAIRPIQFSALKTLDPLQNEVKHAEYHDRQADIENVGHWSPPRLTEAAGPCYFRPRIPVILAGKLKTSCPCAIHAPRLRALTKSMRDGPPRMRRAGAKPGTMRQFALAAPGRGADLPRTRAR